MKLDGFEPLGASICYLVDSVVFGGNKSGKVKVEIILIRFVLMLFSRADDYIVYGVVFQAF